MFSINQALYYFGRWLVGRNYLRTPVRIPKDRSEWAWGCLVTECKALKLEAHDAMLQAQEMRSEIDRLRQEVILAGYKRATGQRKPSMMWLRRVLHGY